VGRQSEDRPRVEERFSKVQIGSELRRVSLIL
jgi:hypothetical protein